MILRKGIARCEIVMRRLFGLICIFVAVSVLYACNDTRSFANEGSLCFNSNVDGTLDLAVWFPTCLSSSCDRALGTSCAIAVVDDEITITSSGAYESDRRGACTADCRPLIAECTSEEPLAPGDYELVHGQDSAELTLPASGVALFEQGFSQCECRAPLSEYCEGSNCPTYDLAVADAELEAEEYYDDGSCFAEAGECGQLRYVRTGSGSADSFFELFDASGALVAVEVFKSGVPAEFCEGRSSNIFYGPFPELTDCRSLVDFCRLALVSRW